MRIIRRPIIGTGWKMNHLAADARIYADELLEQLSQVQVSGIDIFVLPPFTALHAAAAAFADSPVAIGAQNMHWAESGAWTGEISASMLLEAGCTYVELAHAERLTHFGETYEKVRLKVEAALAAGLTPILCLGETMQDKELGRSDEVLRWQLVTALSGLAPADIARVVLAYEPRWAIGQSQSADPEYVTKRHNNMRDFLSERFGSDAAMATRIIYGGSVTIDTAPVLAACENVDGLFVGRQAWRGGDFASVVKIAAEIFANKE